MLKLITSKSEALARTLALLWVLIMAASSAAAFDPGGRASVRWYASSEFGGSYENYRVFVQSDGQIAVANESGLALFDGVRWKLFEHPDQRRGLYALAPTPGGAYCGSFFDDPGCFVRAIDGSYEWHSYLARIGANDQQNQFCNNAIYDAGQRGLWLIYTRKILFVPDQSELPVLRAEHAPGLSGSALHDGQLWTVSMSKRMLRWRLEGQGQDRRIQDQALPEFGTVGTTLRGVVPAPNGQGAWVVMMGGQLLHWQEGSFRAVAEAQWPRWRETNPQSLVRLRDGNYAMSFLRGPLLTISTQGEIREVYGEEQGVPVVMTRGMAEDHAGGLWLAQSGGVVRLDRAYATRSYGREHGLGGSGDVVAWRGQTWLVSNLGVHQFLPEQQAWQRFQPELARFASHAAVAANQLMVQGSRMIRFSEPERGAIVSDSGGALFASKALADRAYVASGTEHFEYFPATGERRALPKFSGSFSHYVEENAQTLWAVARMGKVARFRRDGLSWHDPEYFEQAAGLPGGAIGLEPGTQGLWAGTSEGLRRFDQRASRFVVDPTLPTVLQSEAVQALYQDPVDAQQLWIATAKRAGVAQQDASGLWRWDERVLDAVPRSVAINRFFRQANVLWVARADGVSRIDLPAQQVPRAAPAPFVAAITDLTSGKRLPLTQVIEQAPRQLRVSFAWGEQVRPHVIAWRSRLRGVDAEFNAFSPRAERDWTLLPDGELVLEAQARDGFGRIHELPSIRVRVPTPWHRSMAARVGYVLLALIALLLAARLGAMWRHRSLATKQRELEATVAERTQELARSNFQLAEQAERLAEVDRLKTRFFINVGHEFRTPLTLVLGPVDDLLRDARERFGDKVRDKLQLVQRNARRVLDLIVELLDVNRFEQGQLRLQQVAQELGELIKRVAQDAAPLVERHGHALRCVLPERRVVAAVDALQIERALSNLIGNAAKYMARGGTIELCLRVVDGSASIAVVDQGRGIREQALPHVFDRFFQADGNDHASGYGIGLSLVREIVQAHGGNVQVTSTVGVGSTFTLSLPLAEGEAVEAVVAQHEPRGAAAPDADSHCAAAVALAPSPATSIDNRERLLIVEDHDDMRARLVELMQPRFEVLAAADGNEAWRLARDELPDLIVSDVMMPGCDGVELTRRLRAHAETDAIGVLLLTAKVGSEHAVLGLSAGANDYLEKPFDASELLARCEAILAHARRLRHRLAVSNEPMVQEAPIESSDQRWRQRVDATIAKRLSEPEFDIETLADALHVDRSQLFRRLKELAGVSPSDYLRDARLARARELLLSGAGNISEVAYASGFQSLSSFTRAFKARYGEPPSQVRKAAS